MSYNYVSDDEPLIVAARDGNLPEVNRLLAVPGVKVNMETERGGYTPLYFASQNGHAHVVKRLLAVRGIHINYGHGPDGYTPLYIACQNGHLEVVKLLLNSGVKSGGKVYGGFTPLHAAVKIGHFQIVDELLKNNEFYKVNAKTDADGFTALFLAAREGNIPIVDRLLKNQYIMVNEQTKAGTTALYIASQNGHLPVVKRLLADPIIDVNLERQGISPLYIACQRGHLEIVKNLLAAGADVNATSPDGKTPVDIAREKGHMDIVALFSVSEIPLTKWKGWNRTDIELMNTIFSTEPETAGERRPCENWSCCPICLMYSERRDGCIYMNHNCTTTGRPYHKELYNKYKVKQGYWKGTVCWCTICGRICQQTPHRHFALKHVNDPDASVIDIRADPYGNEPGCLAAGGGGLREKIARFRKMRECALELNSEIGVITHEDAIKKLVEETWNAPLVHNPVLNTILAEKKWNEAVANTAFPLPNVRANNAVHVEAVPWPFADRPQFRPMFGEAGENIISMADVPVLITLTHRQADGSLRQHNILRENGNDEPPKGISIQSLFDVVDADISNTASSDFGKCTLFGDGCTGIIYPDELQYVLDNYPVEHLPADSPDRASYQRIIDRYRGHFNERYRSMPEMKARIDANIAAAATMPVGGAGAAAGQGGGRRRHRVTRRKQYKRKQTRKQHARKSRK
jgi:ankyrin repeat protein